MLTQREKNLEMLIKNTRHCGSVTTTVLNIKISEVKNKILIVSDIVKKYQKLGKSTRILRMIID